MSASGVALHGFAFGEHLEGIPQRSLGYRLLAPAEPEPWAAEIEALARRLQAAPYPDHWPPTELFCSVLLADGQRLVALARYGLADHTPTHRRSGLELIGVVAPGNLGVPTALAIYHWLRERRSESDELRSLGGRHALTEIVTTKPALPAGGDPVPVLPIRLWEQGALLFAATTPSEPDHRLGLLEQGTGGGAWQWLPLVGADFPLLTYAQRGPVVAWTPHLAGVALKLDRKPSDNMVSPSGRRRLLQIGLGVAVLLLLGANLWATVSLYQRLPLGASAEGVPAPSPILSPPAAYPVDGGRDAFVQALQGLLPNQSVAEWSPNQLRDLYQRLAQSDERLRTSSLQGQALVATVSLLSRRSAVRIEALVRDALTNKGYDAELIELACRRIHEHLRAEIREAP